MIHFKESIMTLPDSIIQDTLNHRSQVEKFLNGQTSPVAFRAYRVPMGIYEQRISGKYMVRIRIPAGVVFPYQLKRIAELARTYGNGIVHVTTRQEFQIHEVNIENTPDVLEGLLDVRLSSRGGGGNTVRNITACPRGGVCPYEEFDVTGFAVALTEYFLQDKGSFNLPRKFKTVFSGCSRDCSFASVADLGFFAKVKNGKKGFTVYAGGGLGPNPEVGIKIEDFIPAQEVFYPSEAVKRLFDEHGDRTNKHRARLRYVLKRLGAEDFISVYKTEKEKIFKQGLPNKAPEIKDIHLETNLESRHVFPRGDRKTQIYQDNILGEKNPGLYSVRLSLNLGNIPADDLIKVSQIAERYGEGLVRATQLQDLLICSVPEEHLEKLISELKDLSIDIRTGGIPKIVTCTGADTCKLGLCLSKGLAQAIRKAIPEQDLPPGFKDYVFRISGCPNSCGNHYIADLGFQGKAERVNGRLMPTYDIFYGAHISEGNTRLAQRMGTLPAKGIPAFISELLVNPTHFTGEHIKNLISLYNETPPEQFPSDYYYDFGSLQPFSLAGRGPGECGAGVMDVIKLDIDEAKKLIKITKKLKNSEDSNVNLYKALISATRALLVTFGLEPKKDREIFTEFSHNLIEPGWVKPESQYLMDAAMDWRMGDRNYLYDLTGQIEDLTDRIEELFYSLDSNLKFKIKPLPGKTDSKGIFTKSYFVDLRGVACPLNFVKAKLELEKIEVGEVLEILLDDGEPIQNVPASFQEQEQEIMEIKKMDNHYCVKVRRKV